MHKLTVQYAGELLRWLEKRFPGEVEPGDVPVGLTKRDLKLHSHKRLAGPPSELVSEGTFQSRLSELAAMLIKNTHDLSKNQNDGYYMLMRALGKNPDEFEDEHASAIRAGKFEWIASLWPLKALGTSADRVGRERATRLVSRIRTAIGLIAEADTGDGASASEAAKTIRDDGRSEDSKPQPAPAEQRAYASFVWVCSDRKDLVPTGRQRYSRAQYGHIFEHECPAYTDEEKHSMRIPAFETWKRQIRAGDPKEEKGTTPRAGRDYGSSIARADQI